MATLVVRGGRVVTGPTLTPTRADDVVANDRIAAVRANASAPVESTRAAPIPSGS